MNQWTEHTFTTFDNTSLFYRVRKPAKDTGDVLLLLHRGHEHSGRITNLADELDMADKWCFSFDLRGHGLSPGPRGWAKDFDVWVKDLNSFAVHICTEHGLDLRYFNIVAGSIGSVMAAAWVHDYAPPIRGMVLAAPAFSIRLYIPFALPMLRLLQLFAPNAFVTSYVRANMLTRDPVEAKRYDLDPLITKRIAVSVLTSLFTVSNRLLSDAKSIEAPVMILSAGDDYVVVNRMQKVFYDRIGSTIKKFIALPGFRHALFHEKDREPFINEMRQFLLECWRNKPIFLPAVITPPRPHTVIEYKKLQEPPHFLKAFYFSILRNLLCTIGSLSDGISYGLQKGFDSGGSLDYVYKNKSAGKWGIGKVIDRFYLNSIGWRGIRIRKKNLKAVLHQVLETINLGGDTPRILDVAAGHGRYLFECAAEVSFPVYLHIRDLMPDNLEAAKRLAKEYRIKTAHFTQNDAFRTDSYYDLPVQPNIIVVSGLFELFADNNLVHNALTALKHVIEPGGYIIYTGQPWHPQIEMIGRVLNSHQGPRWVMRRRIQAEMDDLVKGAGFQKYDTVTDGLGIFSVSVARKPFDKETL